MKNFFRNPVLESELKIRMRSWRAALGVTLYLGVILLIAYLYFKTVIDSMMRYGAYNSAGQTIGLQVYTMLAVLQFVLILLVTPAQTAGAISGEREKQTLDLLLCTKMSSVGIILGKLFSSMSFILLLIIGSIPIFSLVFLFGGVTPGNVVVLFLFYLVTAFAVGSIGIFCSAMFKRTVTATVTAYITIFVLGIVSLILGGYMMASYYAERVILSVVPPPYTPFVFYINPAIGLVDLLAQQFDGMSGGIISDIVRSIFGARRYGAMTQNSGGCFWESWSFWIKNIIVLIAIASILLGISAWKITPIRRRKRK